MIRPDSKFLVYGLFIAGGVYVGSSCTGMKRPLKHRAGRCGNKECVPFHRGEVVVLAMCADAEAARKAERALWEAYTASGYRTQRTPPMGFTREALMKGGRVTGARNLTHEARVRGARNQPREAKARAGRTGHLNAGHAMWDGTADGTVRAANGLWRAVVSQATALGFRLPKGPGQRAALVEFCRTHSIATPMEMR